jgi:hypothetical protein
MVNRKVQSVGVYPEEEILLRGCWKVRVDTFAVFPDPFFMTVVWDERRKSTPMEK